MTVSNGYKFRGANCKHFKTFVEIVNILKLSWDNEGMGW